MGLVGMTFLGCVFWLKIGVLDLQDGHAGWSWLHLTSYVVFLPLQRLPAGRNSLSGRHHKCRGGQRSEGESRWNWLWFCVGQTWTHCKLTNSNELADVPEHVGLWGVPASLSLEPTSMNTEFHCVIQGGIQVSISSVKVVPSMHVRHCTAHDVAAQASHVPVSRRGRAVERAFILTGTVLCDGCVIPGHKLPRDCKRGEGQQWPPAMQGKMWLGLASLSFASNRSLHEEGYVLRTCLWLLFLALVVHRSTAFPTKDRSSPCRQECDRHHHYRIHCHVLSSSFTL